MLSAEDETKTKKCVIHLNRRTKDTSTIKETLAPRKLYCLGKKVVVTEGLWLGAFYRVFPKLLLVISPFSIFFFPPLHSCIVCYLYILLLGFPSGSFFG